jgi:hypothetical protein
MEKSPKAAWKCGARQSHYRLWSHRASGRAAGRGARMRLFFMTLSKSFHSEMRGSEQPG